MKLSNPSAVPVYTISGSSTARPLPEWLARKRKRSLKQDPEYANRVELLQDFEFEEASHCIRISDDGQWVMSTGTYKPQIHTHYLPHLSLSFARHTNALNQAFVLLSSDYSKSLHLQTDRSLQFHTPQGCHYTTRIPRYGRDLKYNKQSAEALVPSVGVNADGSGEVFRLNLELGRFMKGYEVDVGGDDFTSLGGGALQGGIRTGSVNSAAVAEQSHNLMAFGTSLGTIEFWDSRSRSRVSILLPSSSLDLPSDSRSEITALEFDGAGLTLATGSSTGIVVLYDLRSPVPVLKKDQGYGYPIQNLAFLPSSRDHASGPKIMSSDKRIIKIWDQRDGTPWTSVEPAVDLHDVAWYKDSGMLLTANEGRQQHAFFIPQLGPAPKWCSFLDNFVEEMAEDITDPAHAHTGYSSAGEVYDNYKFLTVPELRQLSMDHLIGKTSALRPYMHGYFVAQRLYEEARLISNPDIWQQQRTKSIQEKIDKERESRIRGNKKISVRVNHKLAERLLEREEKNERRRAKKTFESGGIPNVSSEATGAANGPINVPNDDEQEDPQPKGKGVLADPRFAKLFRDEDFALDETSQEFQALNPSTKPSAQAPRDERGFTAVEEEERESSKHAENSNGSSADSSGSSDDERRNIKQTRRVHNSQQENGNNGRISSASYRRSGHRAPQMMVSSSQRKPQQSANLSFGSRFKSLAERKENGSRRVGVTGGREITFAPTPTVKAKSVHGKVSGDAEAGDAKRNHRRDRAGRRSASGNVFRRM